MSSNLELSVTGETALVNKFYEEWDNSEEEICPRCHGTGLDRYEEDECETCFGEGMLPPVLAEINYASL